MKLIRQSILLFGISVIGEFMNKVIHVPLPGSVLGLLLLLSLLLSGMVRVKQIEELTNFLMNHLAVFFVPAGVGLITVAGVLKSSWAILLGISILSSVIVMTITAGVVQLIRRRKL
ncbi:CidA/LrgA family protein [Proteiniclasticum sp. C24MP]|uniref:CidA/LrgA family protein n=1 Tax=Proteiniclasticum sp. C24MP TaxID=3374101 RepID=UPI0037551804